MEERFDFHPGDDVVEEVRNKEQGRSCGEIPAIVGVVDEDEGPVPESEDKLHLLTAVRCT